MLAKPGDPNAIATIEAIDLAAEQLEEEFNFLDLNWPSTQSSPYNPSLSFGPSWSPTSLPKSLLPHSVVELSTEELEGGLEFSDIDSDSTSTSSSPLTSQSWSPASPTDTLAPNSSTNCPKVEQLPLDIDEYLEIPYSNQLPYFTYDLTRDPQVMAIKPSLPKSVLERPAVQPPVESMSITVRSEAFQWVICIKPGLPSKANEKPKRYVTVKDVLDGIYRDLQTRVKGVDQEKMAAPTLEKAMSACRYRRERLDLLEKRVEPPGLKRVDLLYKNHRFKGLSFDPRTGQWVLRVQEM
jgi:hypothetical protein